MGSEKELILNKINTFAVMIFFESFIYCNSTAAIIKIKKKGFSLGKEIRDSKYLINGQKINKELTLISASHFYISTKKRVKEQRERTVQKVVYCNSSLCLLE